MIKKITALVLIALVVVISCKDEGNSSTTNSQPEIKEEAILVMVQDMKPKDLEKYIEITGRLEGITDVNLMSEINGRVVDVFKNLGDWVDKGEAIGRVNNSDTENQLKQSEAALLAGEANLESANISFNVSQNIYKKELISESEFLQSKSNQKNAQANYNGLLASLEISRKNFENSEFIAPVSGYIAELNLEVGEMINSGKQVAGIVNTKRLLIKTGVSESDILYVKKNDQVTIEHNDDEYSGKVTGVGIRPITGGSNYPVEIGLDNPQTALLPGMVIVGNIFSQTFENILYTSIENLREKYDQKFVYVINKENRAEIRTVTLGEKVENNVIITSGIKSGDRLVIDGIDSITNGSLVEIKTGFITN